MLKSVGATGQQIMKSMFTEGFYIGIIGIPLGIASGIAGIGIALNITMDILSDLMGSATSTKLLLSVSWQSVAVAAVIAMATIALSAFIPAKRAARISAIDSIRQTHDIKFKSKQVKSSKLITKLFGIEGMLSHKAFRRNKKRYIATIISLFVSVVLFISAGSFGVYLNAAGQRVIGVHDHDVSVWFGNDVLTYEEIVTFYEKAKDVDEITENAYQFSSYVYTMTDTKQFTDEYYEHRYRYLTDMGETIPEENTMDMTLLFLDDDAYLNYLKELGLPEKEYTGSEAKFPATQKVQWFDEITNRYVSNKVFKDKTEWTFTPRYYDEDERKEKEIDFDVSVTFVDKLPDNSSIDSFYSIFVFAPISQIEQMAPVYDTLQCSMTFKSDNPAVSAEQLQALVNELELEEYEGRVFNAAEFEETNRRMLLVMNIFIYGFVILMSLITVANVFNTITTSINLRRREFAMLKAVGMTGGSLNKMMAYECLFYGAQALIFALPVSLGISYLIYDAVMQGVDVAFMLPWWSIGIAVAGVFTIVFITMMYAIAKVKRENTVEALKSENI